VIIAAEKFCKQCLQTASASGGRPRLWHPNENFRRRHCRGFFWHWHWGV